MSDFSNVIEKIRSKYFELLANNKKQQQDCLLLESKIQELETIQSDLKNELLNLENQLKTSQEDNLRLQNSFQTEKEMWKEQMSNLEKSNEVDFKGIVREIDECIHLVKNNL